MRRDPAPIAAEIRATLAIAAPLAGANLAQMAMQVTNTIMVGHLGASSLAAAGLGASLSAMLLMISQGVLTAVAPLAAHAIGADDHPGAGRVAGAGLILAGLLAVPAFAILTVAPRLLGAIGYAPDLVAQIGRFLRVVRWGAPAFLGYAVLRFLLVAALRPRIVMFASLLALPLNAGLAWVLIFGHLGVPKLGLVGAAATTLTIQWLTLAGFAGYMLLTRVRLAITFTAGFGKEILRIVRLGLPIAALLGLEVGLFATTGVVMGVLGAAALAAHQLVMNVASVTFMVPLGIGQAATVRVAHRLGAGASQAARRAAFVALGLGVSFMAAMSVLLLLAPRAIAALYIDVGDPGNRALLSIVMQLFAIAAMVQVFDGAQVIAVGALRGYRDTAVPMLIAAVGYWAIGFAGGWLLAFPLGFGPVGLWIGLATGLAVVAVSLTLRLRFWSRAYPRGAPPLPAVAASGIGA